MEALAERVGDARLLLAEDLGHDQDVVEEEHFPLVQTGSLTPGSVRNLVQPAVTHQSSVSQHQIRFFTYNISIQFNSHLLLFRIQSIYDSN